MSPAVREFPLVSVKPIRLAPFVRYTQRTALSPQPITWDQFGSAAPTMIVTAGPLTLRTVTGTVTATRLVIEPCSTLPPLL